jgi:hypothetical protein
MASQLFNFLPHGTGAIGIGPIWLGLNAARALKDVPTSGLTATLGILALVLDWKYWKKPPGRGKMLIIPSWRPARILIVG